MIWYFPWRKQDARGFTGRVHNFKERTKESTWLGNTLKQWTFFVTASTESTSKPTESKSKESKSKESKSKEIAFYSESSGFDGNPPAEGHHIEVIDGYYDTPNRIKWKKLRNTNTGNVIKT